MKPDSPSITISRCASCHSRFLPRLGGCPRCGSREVMPLEVAGRGVVLAATQLESPPTGWAAPHRLALVEVEESVRLLAVVGGPLPSIGANVTVRLEGETYRTLEPTQGRERGEGELPDVGRSRRPFEPPR